MSKRELLSEGLANVRESMGDFGGAVHRAPSAGPRAVPAHLVGVTRSRDVSLIEVDRIIRDPAQPREEFDQEALDRLARSLLDRGQLQPIRVRWDEGQGAYVVLVGERRWRAARMAGLATLSCVVVDAPIGADEILAIQMVENALREDLKPIEQANAYRRLLDANGWSARQLAAELSIHHAQVVRAIALLDLPAEVQDRVEQGGLSPATAYEVSKLEDPAAQAELAQAAVAEKLTRSEVAEAVKAVRARRPTPTAKPEPVTLDLGEVAVRITWKKATGITLVQALRKALKEAQGIERQGEVDAA
jgi:ParB family transcriptional regulator, chromosome partitioning protein